MDASSRAARGNTNAQVRARAARRRPPARRVLPAVPFLEHTHSTATARPCDLAGRHLAACTCLLTPPPQPTGTPQAAIQANLDNGFAATRLGGQATNAVTYPSSHAWDN